MFTAQGQAVGKGYAIAKAVVMSAAALEVPHYRIAAEDGLEVVISLDVPPVLGVLQLVLLDVGPEALGDFGTRNRLGTHDFGKLVARRHRRPRADRGQIMEAARLAVRRAATRWSGKRPQVRVIMADA